MRKINLPKREPMIRFDAYIPEWILDRILEEAERDGVPAAEVLRGYIRLGIRTFDKNYDLINKKREEENENE